MGKTPRNPVQSAAIALQKAQEHGKLDYDRQIRPITNVPTVEVFLSVKLDLHATTEHGRHKLDTVADGPFHVIKVSP